MKSNPEALAVAVLMRRRATVGAAARWQPWRWELAEVMPLPQGTPHGPRLLYRDAHEERWLHADQRVELFSDDAEGYYLNLSTEAPCWFVMWRMQDELLPGETEPIACPQAVSLSYHDAGRWLDAQETVEQVAAPPPVLDWLRAFTEHHFVFEPKRRQRPQSFRGLQDRFGNPATVSTGKTRGLGGDRHG